MVTAAGVFRRHRRDRRGMADCPGAGTRPVTAVTAPVERPPCPDVLPPPAEPADGRSCDGGHCNRPSIGWRLYRGQPDWLPVCGVHMDGPAGRTRIYDDQIRPEEN